MTTRTLDHLDDDRCAELVLELLPRPERDAAIAHAERCEACARMLRAHVSAQARAQVDRPGARVRAIPRLSRIAYWLPAAAALLVVSVLIGRNLTARHPGAEATHWLPALGEPQLLRGEAPVDPHLTAGMQAYASRDLRAAARELEAARAEGPAEQARRLYLAHAWLQLREPERSVALLRTLDYTQLPADLSRDALRLLVRALRATGRTSDADSIERIQRGTPEWVPVRP